MFFFFRAGVLRAGVLRAGALLLILMPGLAAAEPGSTAATLAAATCGSCHGERTAPDGIPALAAQPARVLEEKLVAYRRGTLEGTVMNRIARGFDETELAAIAAALGTR